MTLSVDVKRLYAAALKEKKSRIDKAACEASLVEFIKQAWHVIEPGSEYIHNWHVDALANHLEAITNEIKIDGEVFNRLLANVPPGTMKALAVDTPVMTTWGWKKHGDLVPGDFVFGPAGTPKRVIACTPKVQEEAFEVGFEDGAKIVAGAGHLWDIERDVMSVAPRYARGRKALTVPTTDLRPSGYKHGESERRPDRIPIASPIVLPPKRLLVEPYLLGAWLGDGASNSGHLYAAEEDVDGFSHLGEIARTYAAGESGRTQQFYRILVPELQTKLRVLGILNNKHIPIEYKEASIEQRRDLLAGLFDTDGHCDAKGRCIFSNKRENLIEDVYDIACSLGLKPTITSHIAKIKDKSYGVHWNVSFVPPAGLRIFRLERKQIRIKGAQNGRATNRYIESVTSVGPRVVSCIQVEGERYLAGKQFIPTHNSLLVSVFWPAHEWGPRNKPHIRILSTSHDVKLAIRDAIKMRRLVTSEWYVEKWGDRFKITTDQNEKTKFENDAGGFRQASSAKSITGNRADRIIIDDPLSVADAASDIERANIREWFLESVPTRLVNPKKSAIVVIMQRLHEGDVSGTIIENDLGYCHLCLPMMFEEGRRCRTPVPWKAPWMREPEPFCDPRDQDGELLFPARFPQEVVDRDAKAMGEYATAGQMQQRPEPRGGGIIKREYWQIWDAAAQKEHDIKVGMFPSFAYIVASFDGAFTEKKENDYSALTVWGVWVAPNMEQRLLGSPGTPRLMLMHAWRKKLTLHGKSVQLIEPAWGETKEEFQRRKESNWGIIEHIAATCNKFNVDQLIVENKATGHTVEQEIRRLFSAEKWTVRLYDPGGLDKVQRVFTTQHLFADGAIWKPDTDWGQMVEDEFASFPRAVHDDLVDSSVQAITILRKMNMAPRAEETIREYEEDTYYRRPAAGRVFYEA